VCFPSFSPASGAHEYARFATLFHGLSSVTVLPQPGFAGGVLLPADFDALVGMQTEAVRRAVNDGPFVLVGRSVGGVLAHAVAARLEAAGMGPQAVVLLDTYFSAHVVEGFHHMVAAAMVGREGRTSLLSDARVTAMGGYQRILTDWVPVQLADPTQISARTLLVRAADPFADDMVGDGWRASLVFPHEDLEVPGDHFTMLEAHAESTAHAVRAWMSTTFQNSTP
jgi:thioesterase domain-containing protein